MARTKRTQEATEPAYDLADIVARLSRAEAVLSQLSVDLQPSLQLSGELTSTRTLALEALAQAQDAHETSRLSAEHETRLNTLTLAVAEGIQHVERAEARIRATVRRARAELASHDIESPSLEAEARSLQLLDGEGGGSGVVPAMRPEVAQDVPAFDDGVSSAVPGMTRGQLRKFGRG